MMMQKKQAGISILISLAVSFILFGIAVTILYLVTKSQEQNVNLEKTNQSFFALESGLEAGLYHHNARGQGSHFFDSGAGTSDAAKDAPNSQTITLDNGQTIKWVVRGRTENLPDSDVVHGIIKEGQIIEIPFYWTDESNIALEPNAVQENITDLNFSLSFSQFEFNDDGTPSSTKIIPDGFDFGSVANNVLLYWVVSKLDSSGNLTTFIPRSSFGTTVLCDPNVGVNTAFYCEQNLGQSITSVTHVPGYIVPGRTDTYPADYPVISLRNEPVTLSNFYSDDDTNSARFKISLEPILPFTASNGTTKIPGIPWALKINNVPSGFPKPTYEIEVLTESQNINKSITRTYNEKTALEGLDSLIIE